MWQPGQERSLEENGYTYKYGCFPCGSAGKESASNAGDQGLIPGLGRYPGEGNGNPLQYSGLENSWTVTKIRIQLSDFQFHDSQFKHPELFMPAIL